ncbi:C10 family peptidase [Porphyromonadaceae bacterium W3.11]|nr:C10 family peptidase [Porphyromonadaceae bacterium W3.11]
MVVEPLLGDIAWDQMPHYNALAPNPQVPIGCVATATSQIMRYWEYPEKAIGNYSYRSKIFGVISFDFNHTFDWEHMPKETLTEPNEDIAILCYGVAVSINMNFDYAYNGGSGAIHGDVPPALYRHYGYPKTVQNVRRSDFDDATWTQMLKKELDNRRPVQYGGTGSGGGHSFVLDGYDSTDLFHVNWGWAGQSNGWFKLNALDPDDLGTGGGSGGFNKNQDMIINFAPPARIDGDHNDLIQDDEETDHAILDNGVSYDEVYVPNVLDFYIRYTKFGTLATTSRGSGYSAYLDKAIDVVAGQNLDFTIEYVQNADKVFPKIAIFIDLNDDGKFDADSEMMYDTPIGEYSELQSGSYSIKSDVKKGLHRMRVINYNAHLKDPNTKVLINGEVEDYYVNVK